jgi:hypothetical protein
MNFDIVGGRRFALAVASLISADLLQWFGKLDLAGTAYGLTIGATVAAYITGNVMQRKHEGESAK